MRKLTYWTFCCILSRCWCLQVWQLNESPLCGTKDSVFTPHFILVFLGNANDWILSRSRCLPFLMLSGHQTYNLTSVCLRFLINSLFDFWRKLISIHFKVVTARTQLIRLSLLRLKSINCWTKKLKSFWLFFCIKCAVIWVIVLAWTRITTVIVFNFDDVLNCRGHSCGWSRVCLLSFLKVLSQLLVSWHIWNKETGWPDLIYFKFFEVGEGFITTWTWGLAQFLFLDDLKLFRLLSWFFPRCRRPCNSWFFWHVIIARTNGIETLTFVNNLIRWLLNQLPVNVFFVAINIVLRRDAWGVWWLG